MTLTRYSGSLAASLRLSGVPNVVSFRAKHDYCGENLNLVHVSEKRQHWRLHWNEHTFGETILSS